MSAVRLSIQPRFCGPGSVGTVEVVHLVREHAHLGLAEAKRLVDRCVFDGKRVLIPMRSSEDAAALVDALRALSDDPRIEATVED